MVGRRKEERAAQEGTQEDQTTCPCSDNPLVAEKGSDALDIRLNRIFMQHIIFTVKLKGSQTVTKWTLLFPMRTSKTPNDSCRLFKIVVPRSVIRFYILGLAKRFIHGFPIRWYRKIPTNFLTNPKQSGLRNTFKANTLPVSARIRVTLVRLKSLIRLQLFATPWTI